MLSVSIVEPDERAMVAGAQTILQGAGSLVIVTPDDYSLAGSTLSAIKAQWKQLDFERKDIVKDLDSARAKIQARYLRPMNMLIEAEAKLKQMMLSYQTEQARVQAERQRAIEETARKERARLAEEAAKVQAKAREQAEHARQMAELAEQARLRAVAEGNAKAAAAAAQRNAKLAEQAQSIELAGKEKAAELQTISDLVVAPTVQSAVPKVAGQFNRTTFKARVVDHEALIQDVANKLHYADVLPPDEGVLNRLAAVTGGRLQLAGVECYEVVSLTSRAAK